MITRITVAGILFLVLVCFNSHITAEQDDFGFPSEGLNPSSTATRLSGHQPIITILYCHSCGYKKAFDDYSAIIRERYPDIQVNGGYYEDGSIKTYLARLVSMLKLAVIMLVVSNYDIWGSLGIAIPGWWVWCKTNKIYSCMMIFFMGNLIESQLTASGAFEMSLNNIPIWSKMQSNRVPSATELFQIIDSHLQFDAKQMPENFVK